MRQKILQSEVKAGFPLGRIMAFKLPFEVRIPLAVRRKNGIIYYQLQLDVIGYGTLTPEFHKIEAAESLSDIGRLTFGLLNKFKEKPELEFSEIAEIAHIEQTDWDEIKSAISEKRLKFMGAKDSKDLDRTYDECGICYTIASDLYEFHLFWMYREGSRWWYDSAKSTGKPTIFTFDEPLAFTDKTAPEEVGRMLIEALDRSRQMADRMSGDYCPPVVVELLSEGFSVSIKPPKDKHFVDAEDYGTGEIYQGYSYFPNEDAESIAEFYLGIGAELNCGLSEENVRLTWEKYDGKADFFEMKEIKHQLFTIRAEMKNKNTHRISYYKKFTDDEILECAMTLKRPNQKKKLDEKLSRQFEDFAFRCNRKT
jgi:hypothetical protein